MNKCPNPSWDCCCKCKYQKKIYCHPCNTRLGYGKMNKLFGYICTVLSQYKDEKHIIFMDHKHSSGCELFTKK